MMRKNRREYIKQWRKDNPEKVKASYDKWLNKPGVRERKTAYRKQWYRDHPERGLARRKEYASLPETKARRYALYRKALGPGHKQNITSYLRTPEAKALRLKASMQHYTTRKTYLWGYKAERGCKICGERDAICLDFHHREKSEKNPKLIRNGKGRTKGSWFVLGIAALQVELAKVDVLCANCHRKLHRDEKGKTQ